MEQSGIEVRGTAHIRAKECLHKELYLFDSIGRLPTTEMERSGIEVRGTHSEKAVRSPTTEMEQSGIEVRGTAHIRAKECLHRELYLSDSIGRLLIGWQCIFWFGHRTIFSSIITQKISVKEEILPHFGEFVGNIGRISRIIPNFGKLR